nr:MAG TPA: hypothetical protein [Caudoviricetes sp.]
MSLNRSLSFSRPAHAPAAEHIDTTPHIGVQLSQQRKT